MTEPRNLPENTGDGRFRPGNPGKPKGARSRVTLAIEALLEGQHEALTKAAIDKALEGDTVGRDWLEEIADDVARIANVEGR